ncbi:MAG: cytochrome d ubiquinol oxidase subunit II [Henriciella sp.]
MDYPLIWSMLIATAVMMYVLLDGMDLGVGMLTFFAAGEEERNMMTATIEPVWDGNETWLVLGGGGLFAAFPLAYSILMPSFYLPVLVMLAALIFRGVAFEFRHKAVRRPTRLFWNGAFYGGSFMAALSQGIILGAFIQGVATEGRSFAGGTFDWLTPFSLLVGIAVVVGYILLAACWLVLKTEGALYNKARNWGLVALAGVSIGFALVSMATLSVDLRITERWGFSMTGLEWGKLLSLAPVPLAGLFLTAWLTRDLLLLTDKRQIVPDWRPYLLAAGIFLSGYIGLAISLFPWLVPFEFTIWETAARDNALAFMLGGAAIMLPVILIYTVYVYSLFWGKVKPGDGYHEP